jgi:hypothetical protein
MRRYRNAGGNRDGSVMTEMNDISLTVQSGISPKYRAEGKKRLLVASRAIRRRLLFIRLSSGVHAI